MKKIDARIPQSNPFLDRWKKISCDHSGEPAIFSTDGRILRTFASLDTESDCWADRLASLHRAQLVVSIETGNNPEWPSILLGIWKARGVAVLGSSSMPGGADLTARVVPGEGGLPTLLPVAKESAGIDGAVDLIKVTSGTHSGGRAVGFSAAQLLADAANIRASMGIRRTDRNVGVIPFSHSYGLSNLFGLLVAEGVPLVLGDPLPRSVIEALTTGGGTVLPVVPALVRALAAVGGPSGSLRLCLSAGVLLPPRDAKAFRKAFGKKVHTFYGASECGGICFDSDEDPDVPEGYLGTPMHGVKVQDEQAEGGLRVSVESGAVALGYLAADDETNLRLGVFRPTDLLEKCGDGYRMLGREGEWINVAGRKVNPAQIEAVLRGIPGVADCVVFGIPDESARGEQVAACLVGPDSSDRVRNQCAGILPAWQIPRRWFLLDSLPVDERGKLSRRRLKQMLTGG